MEEIPLDTTPLSDPNIKKAMDAAEGLTPLEAMRIMKASNRNKRRLAKDRKRQPTRR